MVMSRYSIKQGDLRPPYKAQLKTNGASVDLSGATRVDFHMCSKPDKEYNVLDKEASFIGKSEGTVQYEWESGDTDVESGTYHVEFKITWGDGDPETWPSEGFREIKITEAGA